MLKIKFNPRDALLLFHPAECCDRIDTWFVYLGVYFVCISINR